MVRDHFWQRVSLFQQYYTKMIRNFQSREATALVSSLIGMCGIDIFIFVQFLKKKLVQNEIGSFEIIGAISMVCSTKGTMVWYSRV